MRTRILVLLLLVPLIILSQGARSGGGSGSYDGTGVSHLQSDSTTVGGATRAAAGDSSVRALGINCRALYSAGQSTFPSGFQVTGAGTKAYIVSSYLESPASKGIRMVCTTGGSTRGLDITYSGDLASGNVITTYQNTAGSELTDSDAEQAIMKLTAEFAQTGTATGYGLWIDMFETSFGDGTTGEGNALINAQVDGATKHLVDLNGIVNVSVSAGLTAVNPGGQGDGLLTAVVNEVSTVANANDAVTVQPAPATGSITIKIINNGANTLEIWPSSGDDIGGGVDTAITLAAGSNIELTSYDATTFESF